MTIAGELYALAERCERSTGHDIELDHAIGRALGTNGNYSYQPYTASLDAAMKLVGEPEKGVSVWRTPRDGGLCCATVHHGEVAEAKTMQGALCAAALRAAASGTLPRENTEDCSRAKPSGPTAESGDAQPTPVSDPISNKGR